MSTAASSQHLFARTDAHVTHCVGAVDRARCPVLQTPRATRSSEPCVCDRPHSKSLSPTGAVPTLSSATNNVGDGDGGGGDGGGGSVDEMDHLPLAACERFDVRVRVAAWYKFPDARAFRVARVHRDVGRHAVRFGAAYRTRLTRAENARSVDCAGFAHRLPSGLNRLRSLALLYVSAPYRDFFAAVRRAASLTDRLESLAVRNLDLMLVSERHTEQYMTLPSATLLLSGAVRVAARHVASASPAMSQMRPRRLLDIRVAPDDATSGQRSRPNGRRLLNRQPRARASNAFG